MARAIVLPEINKPWGPQLDFLKSGAVFKRYQGGQGSGKTVAGCFEVRRYTKRWPGSIVICTEPTYGMVRDILHQEFDRQFEAAGETNWVTFRASEEKYRCANGSEIWLRQCDKSDALRGPSVAAVWMDEAAQSPHSAFQILVGRVRQPGYPPLFLATGTPRGKNWLYWVFTPGDRPPGGPGYMGDALAGITVESFFGSSTANPYLSPIARASLEKAYPVGTLLHRQEVLGETVVFEGLIYSQFDPELHVAPAPGPEAFVSWGLGVDWGWTHPGVILLGGLTREDALWITSEVYETERSLDWWRQQGQILSAGRSLRGCWCDPSEPGNIDHFRAGGLPSQRANNEVIPGITLLCSRIAQGKFMVAPDCRNLIRELTSQQWKPNRDGSFKPDEPEKIGDDANDAARYLVMGLAKPPASGRIIPPPPRRPNPFRMH